MPKSSYWRGSTLSDSFRRFLLINLAIATILSLLQCPSCFLSLTDFIELLPDFVFSFLMSSALSFGGITVEAYFDKRISWIEKPVKRLILTVSVYILYCFVISLILIIILVLMTVPEVTLQTLDWARVIRNTVNPILIALVIITIFVSRSWLMEWRNVAIEAEQLKSNKLAFQYQSLKDQLNPHFLFNSLNVLSHLVYEDADKSAAFIQQLSKIYRYVLDVQQEELVSLEKELEFARNYLSLQHIRFGESLKFSIDSDLPRQKYLPPLSLQLLLENAVKHNIASSANPLYLSIGAKDGYLWIANNLQPKLTQSADSSGIGLSNIRQRYALLSNVSPVVEEKEGKYWVGLPLLDLKNTKQP
jgi:sensor histidine kinase YesM